MPCTRSASGQSASAAVGQFPGSRLYGKWQRAFHQHDITTPITTRRLDRAFQLEYCFQRQKFLGAGRHEQLRRGSLLATGAIPRTAGAPVGRAGPKIPECRPPVGLAMGISSFFPLPRPNDGYPASSPSPGISGSKGGPSGGPSGWAGRARDHPRISSFLPKAASSKRGRIIRTDRSA
jgi:hypothetical protein